MIETCRACAGTGRCQTCYLPVRGDDTPNHAEVSKQRRIVAINSQIYELRTKIEKLEWDMRDCSYSSYATYIYVLQLKSTYEKQIMELQFELNQLESM